MLDLAVLDAGQGVVQPPVDGCLMALGRDVDLIAHVGDVLDRADDGGRTSAEHFQQLNGEERKRKEIYVRLCYGCEKGFAAGFITNVRAMIFGQDSA